ncbi:DMT family transporter [Oscillatoria salina]|uniref:DMT family transporter n=1 Tax=Oscillatoria salina TaxID=331517 RepID=UPI0013BCDD4D|nr:DMT family transporter [Oscillatoria salina]MBZ8178934.1 DMT family transporter [Oscillatoria salina IIICB1]NET90970.1 DMT family transporter [Kamptonema sp. SIO1D9]
MSQYQKPPQWQIGLILTLGVAAISSTAIFIRLATSAVEISSMGFSLFLAASRVGIAALILLPAWRKLITIQVQPSAYYYAAAAGICLALHIAVWITSLSFTSIAASTTLVTTNPIWVALLSWWWLGEKPTRLSAIGIIIALCGGIAIAWGDSENISTAATNPILGDILALIGSWLVSLYLLLGRQAQQRGFAIGNYIAVAYTTAALVLLPLPKIFGSGYLGYPKIVYLYVLGIAIFSQLIGHTSFNWAIRIISPTLVTLAILFEPIGASLLGWLIFNEIPGNIVIFGAIILLIGVAIAVIGNRKST